MERVGVDVLGPFPVTDLRQSLHSGAMDYFTKWPEAFAIPDQSAATTAERLVEEMFPRFGAPAELHSDQGRNFESQLMAEVCKRLASAVQGVQPTHPCCPDVRTGSSGHQWTWCSGLRLSLKNPAVLGRSTTTGCGTASLVAHDFARKAQASAGVKQKRWYDTRCRGRAFAAGEQVWVYCPERKKGLSPKLRASWRGPGEIVERALGGGLSHQDARPGAPGGATSRPASTLQAPGNS
ncbi:hypothetical protein SKAU_G00138500 [Synaphobranchus kaupii]|uniref:Integrase catalytic domain-containing protein n=1 Tax=Synaphobranchus kaupii TaxID=118154 RepID=A0A9Q1FS38_SYNKA|nr:hypothetical protein SKAU_G00138500 [Synaphobranchus kaupii]